MIKKFLYKTAIMVMGVLWISTARAQFEEGRVLNPVSGMPALTTSDMHTGSTNTVQYSGTVPVKCLNIVTLKIKETEPVVFASGFTATANIDVELTDVNNNVTNDNITLVVNYDTVTGAKYTVRDYKTYTDYVKVKVTFASNINVTGATGWDPKDVLELENEMRVTEYANLSTNLTDLAASLSTSQPTADVLDVAWSFPGAARENMTQIEWAYAETEMLGYYGGDYDALFRNNSSRADIDFSATGYSFKIPLLYGGAGKLYYRVRAMQRKGNCTLITGPWSVSNAGSNSFSFSGHSDSLNWQSSSTFAEEGKYKSVIQYFDGSLRSRQTVTKDNSTGNTVVAETIYDLQGRPNIQILPTPTIDNTIKYFMGFNRFINMAADDDPSKYFDLTPAAVKCNGAVRLDSMYGNGRYYSVKNDWLASEAKSKFIPDAKGYAFTETRFTDDATQRVVAQGGVGPDHQINSGHETRYFYGKPSQPELDALFGTEAGDASHYFKNMVQDANGQMSISYSDMHGRTVATSLAGDPTPGIDSVINSTDYPLMSSDSTIRNQLLTPATNIISGNSITSVSSILAPSTTAYHFVYELNPAILALTTCNNTALCFDCKYDLEISIRSEECDSAKSVPVVRRYKNLQAVPAVNACSTSMGFTGPGFASPVTQISFDTTLSSGSYIIRKTLTINDSMFQVRRDSALKVLICKTKDSIYNHIYDSLAILSGCGLTPSAGCDTCLSKLGTFPVYAVNYLNSIAPLTLTLPEIHLLYAEDSLQCAIACGTGVNAQFSTLKNYRDQMLADMVPFTGQYATDTIRKDAFNNVDYHSIDAQYNIFSDHYIVGSTTYTTGMPRYRHPETEGGLLFYYDDDNNIDNTVHAPITIGVMQHIIDTITKAPFAELFKDRWKYSLLKKHPEYSKLQYAESALLNAYTWLDNAQGCTHYATATTSGYTIPVKITTSTINDPYLLLAGTSTDKDTLDYKLYHGITYAGTSASIWQIANGEVLCNTVDSALRYSCIMMKSATGLDAAVTGDANKDIVWEKLRTLYLSYRNEMVLRYIQNHATAPISQTDMDRLTTEGKQLTFAKAQDMANQNGWTWWAGVTNPSGLDTTGLGVYIANNSTDNCNGQRPFWKARLMQCDVLTGLLNNNNITDSNTVNTIINTILDSMVMVCQHSLTAQQPYGASTVNPSYSGTPQSFENIINHVFGAYGIHTLPGDHYFCNPFSVDFPKPFGLNPPVSVNYTNTLDSCACGRYAALQAEALANGYNPTILNGSNGFNHFLAVNYHDSLTQVLWEGLQHCDSLFTDTCATNRFARSSNESNVSCLKPVIHSLVPMPAYYYSELTFTLPDCGENGQCTALMFDEAGGLVESNTNICGGTTTDFKYLPKNCERFKFVIECYSEACGTLISDTFYYTAYPCDTIPCPKPFINSITYNADAGMLTVYYETASEGCGACDLFVYKAGTLLDTYTIPCGNSSYQFEFSGEPCDEYSFLIVCKSKACGDMVSDSFHFIVQPCEDPCNAEIGNVVFEPGGESSENTYPTVQVIYTTPEDCENCSIYIYDAYNNFVTYESVNCGSGVATLAWVPDSCAYYKIFLKCFSETCGKVVSDTFYLTTPCIVTDSCKPILHSVTFNPEDSYAFGTYITYTSPAGCGGCGVKIFDSLNNYIGYYSVACGSGSAHFYWYPEDSCAQYKFVLLCNSLSCGIVASDTFYYHSPCLPNDTCNPVYHPIILPEFVPLPSFLNCGYVKPCITCAKLDSLTAEFRLLYPAYNSVPYTDSTATEPQIRQNLLWARFLNYRTGFSKNVLDYLEAYKNCHSGTPPLNALCAFDPPLNAPGGIYPPAGPCEQTTTQAQFLADLLFESMKDSLLANFDSLYKAKCLGAQSHEVFYAAYRPKEYHYTLYYYDQAGNLIKTMPPAAVRPNYNSGFLNAVIANRNAGTDLANTENNEELRTEYRYNSLNQVVAQRTPDAGESKFWYDKLGRLVVSQNAQQFVDNKYSFTLYDDLGRITQVGQKPQNDAMTQAISQNPTSLQGWLNDQTNGSLKEQITRTVYDVPYFEGEQPAALEPVLYQKNLRNRVSYTQLIPLEPATIDPGAYAGVHSAATYYSYDIHGNVDTLIQDFNGSFMKYIDPTLSDPDLNDEANMAGNRYKKLVYEYDLISGKVNKVSYQPGKTDQYYHKYGYDGENRLTEVQTSHDKVYWEHDAAYSYYRHGPLNRIELGENKVQGLDYIYTIQGWLKGVNSSSVLSTEEGTDDVFDAGLDGTLSANTFARDVFGYSLQYFGGDYKSIGGTSVNPFVTVPDILSADADDGVQTGRNLFNGNIRAMSVNIPKLGDAMLYGYRYDQLNRIKAMNSFNNFANATNEFSGGTPGVTTDYKERVSYDPNGNIRKYLRHGAAALTGGTHMDSLTYKYEELSSGKAKSNKLRYVHDGIANGNYSEDIDSQTALTIGAVNSDHSAAVSGDNYAYDAIGNLVKDTKEHISTITWNVYGKISSILKDDNTLINYGYDASGNRILKSVDSAGLNNVKFTYYVRDASGNVMSIYRKGGDEFSGELTQTEVSKYGSSRLGIWNAGRAANIVSTDYSNFRNSFVRGNKSYELSNHLGNVLATISDKKFGVDDGTYLQNCSSHYDPITNETIVSCSWTQTSTSPDGIVDYYRADVVTANDYYPFGMQMPGRKYSQGGQYRYGFNGQEKSNEISSESNSYTAEYWEYDSKIGRRWNVDPAIKSHESGYMAFANNPIWFTDHTGRDTTRYYNNDGKLLMTLGNGKAGYNRAMVVKDDKVKAIQQYVNSNIGALNSGKAITNSTTIDNQFKSYGDLYDLSSFTKFYEDNKGKYSVGSMRGHSVDDMTSITVNGKIVSKAIIKNLKGAEATAYVKRIGGILTVDAGTTASDNDAFQSNRPYISTEDMANVTHIHLHPFWNMNIEYKGKDKYGSFYGYEPGKGIRDGSLTGDISRNSNDGRNKNLPRTVVVSDQSIRLITGTLSETIYIKRL